MTIEYYSQTFIKMLSAPKCILGNFTCFLLSADFFSNLTFSEKSFRNTISVSNSLDLDQAFNMEVQAVCKGYQQTALVDKENLHLIKMILFYDIYLEQLYLEQNYKIQAQKQ